MGALVYTQEREHRRRPGVRLAPDSVQQYARNLKSGEPLATVGAGGGRLGRGAGEADLPLGPVHRLAARRGGKRAALAVAHTILVIAYHMMDRGQTYADLGGNYFDERDRPGGTPVDQAPGGLGVRGDA